MGLGHFGGGIGAVRYLVMSGARVTVTDLKDGESLKESVESLQDLDVVYHLGEHRTSDFTEADLLVVSPAVPKKTSPYIKLARQHRVPITSEMNLFLQACPAPICAVTGSVGKSTTTAMIHYVMDRTQTFRKCFLGGNIGRSLLPDLDAIGSRDLVVLELSSFMLDDAEELYFHPKVAVVTNIVPNHLDRYGEMADYVRSKKLIARFQVPDDTLILNRELMKTTRWKDVGDARRVIYSPDDPLPDGKWNLAVPGRHNVTNGLAAFHACLALGARDYEIVSHLNTFSGLPDRLELVASIAGIHYVNDSKATTPESTITALEAFEKKKIILIAGGSPKNTCFTEMARRIVDRVRLCVVLGRTGPEIGREMRAVDPDCDDILLHADSLERAVALAHDRARPGDVVLLSPGCASFDMFDNYTERGNRFRQLIRSLK